MTLQRSSLEDTGNTLIADVFDQPTEECLIDGYTHLERYVNDGSPSGFSTDVPAEFSPSSPRESFELPVYLLSRSALVQVGMFDYSWATAGASGGQLPLPLHPVVVEEVLKLFPFIAGQPRLLLTVIPTSSGRTVLVRSEKDRPHFIKLHYPYELGRFPRDLCLYKWIAALENSRELDAHTARFPTSLAFLPESGGVFLPDRTPQLGVGAIFREFVPHPERRTPTFLVPAFSLFARRVYPAILTQILETLSDQPVETESFISHFVLPALQAFAFLALDLGLIPEMHAQNVLFEVALTLKKTRVIIRDLGDLFKDYVVRRERNLHTSFCSYKSIDPKVDSELFQRRSFAFDFKFSHYLLRPLAECFAAATGKVLQSVLERIREVCRIVVLQRAPDYFSSPNLWYCYPNKRNVGRREYQEQTAPLFR